MSGNGSGSASSPLTDEQRASWTEKGFFRIPAFASPETSLLGPRVEREPAVIDARVAFAQSEEVLVWTQRECERRLVERCLRDGRDASADR